jgi:RNA polymerase sigma factor (TIGR02999 family)
MAAFSDDTIAALVARADGGDVEARGALFSALYDDLHRLAQAHVRRSVGPLTLGATTLLHEAYLAISRSAGAVFPDRNRFLGYASRAMRGLVINYVRDRSVEKRGGDLTFVPLDESRDAGAARADELEALGTALDDLAQVQPDLAELVDLKFFCGFSFAEIAAMRGVSERTVQRDWAKARLLLHRALEDG